MLEVRMLASGLDLNSTRACMRTMIPIVSHITVVLNPQLKSPYWRITHKTIDPRKVRETPIRMIYEHDPESFS